MSKKHFNIGIVIVFLLIAIPAFVSQSSQEKPDAFKKIAANGYIPSWSPDGKFIAYTNKGDLWQLNMKTGEVKPLYASEKIDTRPSWSPDGSKIAFDSGDPRRTGNADIYILGADGKNLKQLTDHPKLDAQPDWSPDGQWIAFLSEESGNRDIWIMRADGTRKTQLTFDPGMDVWPRWSPDGTKIAYGSQRQAKDKKAIDIWLIDLVKQLGKGFIDRN